MCCQSEHGKLLSNVCNCCRWKFSSKVFFLLQNDFVTNYSAENYSPFSFQTASSEGSWVAVSSPHLSCEKSCSTSLREQYLLLSYLGFFYTGELSCLPIYIFIQSIFMSIWPHGYVFWVTMSSTLFCCAGWSGLAIGALWIVPVSFWHWVVFCSFEYFLTLMALQDPPGLSSLSPP